MTKIWNKLSILSQYYLMALFSFVTWWAVFYLFDIEFINRLFFMTAFIWHFTLVMPGIKKRVLTKQHPLSFINVVVKVNYYLQLFIKIDKWAFGPSIVRALSPLLFTFFLMVASANGSIVFSIIGSISFEIAHYFMNKKTISALLDDVEIPPAIPNVKNSHE